MAVSSELVCRDHRGVSHVLGVVLVVSIVLTGIVAIVGFGVAGLFGTDELSETAAERDLEAVAAAVERETIEATGPTGTRRIELSIDEVADEREWFDVTDDAGSIEILARSENHDESLLSESLGLIEFESPRSSARIAYQAGLVLSGSAGEPAGRIRSPQFTHRADEEGESVTLHIPQIRGETQVDRELQIRASGASRAHPELLIPADQSLVIRVTSSAADAWERTLAAVFPDDATLDRSGETVELEYATPNQHLYLHAWVYDIGIDGR